MTEAAATGDVNRALIVVENLSVPRDPRVWQECLSLRRAGLEVAVICPKGKSHDRDTFELREGVEIYRYPLRYASGSRFSYVAEYAMALWGTWRLLRARFRQSRVDVVHVCNPPDFLLAAAFPLPRGTRLLFDHHDLVPELYLAHFAGRKDFLYRLLLRLERLALSRVDVVVSTNESYRRIALARGGKDPRDVFVVRNAPDLARITPTPPDPALKRGKPYLIAYVGVMGRQDGIDLALFSLASLKSQRSDWHATFIGEGDVLDQMRELADDLDLEGCVEFRGWLGDAEIARLLSTADLCIAPEPKNPLNDASTMMKIAEYLAFSRPVVSFDLHESRVTAGPAALYVRANDVQRFGASISDLLDDPARRKKMGALGRARVETSLSWAHSERSLFAAYERLLGRPLTPSRDQASDARRGAA